MKRHLIIKSLNSLAALTLMGILLAAYYQQFFKHEMPCPLCILQRLAMLGVSTGYLLNLRCGIKPSHYAISLLSSLFGGSVAMRQILLHICPGSPVFGYPVFGISLYTWSFLAFTCSFAAIIVLLFFYTPETAPSTYMSLLDKFTFTTIFIITLCNTLTTLNECHFGPCEDVPWPPAAQESL